MKLIGVINILSLCIFGCTSDIDFKACTPGESNDCNCSTGTPSSQYCNEQGTGWGQCVCTEDDITETVETSDILDEEGCGNQIVDRGEDCDGTNFDDATCEDYGYDQGGELTCNNCRLDLRTCTGADGVCLDPLDFSFIDGSNSWATEAAFACTADCSADEPCTAECVADEVEISADCTECYVAAARCCLEHCEEECFPNVTSMACDDCQAQHDCFDRFWECSGVFVFDP